MILINVPHALLCEPRTPWVYILRPVMGGSIEDDEPNRQPREESYASADGQLRARYNAAILAGDVRWEAGPKIHPYEQGPEKRSVDEIHREGVLTKPQQVFIREDILRDRGEVDSEGDEFETDAGVETGEFGICW